MMHIRPEIFIETFKDRLIVTGGHFLITPNGLPNLNEGTVDSFRTACDVYTRAKEKGFDVSLGILVNNMGAVCDAKRQICALDPDKIKEDFSLPKAYLEILKHHRINPDAVRIYWEKSLRNLGKKQLVKQVKRHNARLEYKDGAYWFSNPLDNRRITLSRTNPHDKYGIPACPLIMAALSEQMKKDGFDSSLNFYYVDLENEDNIPNYFAIEKGRTVAQDFYPHLEITNVYLLKDRVVTSAEMRNV